MAQTLRKNNVASILLYNPISGHGHLDGWMAMFAAILPTCGYTVYCLTPDTEALLLRLRQKGMEQHPGITILPWQVSFNKFSPSYPLTQWRHFKELVYYLSNTYGNRLEGSRITSDMPFLRRCKKRLLQLLIRRPMRLSTPPDKEDDYFSPEDLGRRVKNALKILPTNRYFLFNMYMDMYRTDKASWKKFSKHCALPWTGIRFVPEPEPREAYYALSTLRGMCFMDEMRSHAYSAALPGKHFANLPDIADASLPDDPPPAVQTIVGRAAGRKVVFMGGSIDGRKNINQWYKLIRQADPQRFFFAQIGEIHYGTCTQEEQNILHELSSVPPENFFMIDKYLTDERDFNACIAASDVIFAVYKNFRISSNMLGKAAAFEKPILVSDLYLMGENVRHYGLGAAVPEDDPVVILAALERLIQTPPAPENYAAYNIAHNEEALGQALEEFFTACLHKRTENNLT